MTLRIAPCSAEELEVLLSLDLPSHVATDHRERFALQRKGEATYLLAWQGNRNVGRATLYAQSKYEVVRESHPGVAEINALDANPQGRGTGSALIAAAEAVAGRRGHSEVGLGVELSNSRARRLYQRLGYTLWGGGQIVDEWTEHHDSGADIRHADLCDYLIKPLTAAPN